MAKSAVQAKRNPENPANPVNPDSDKDARFAHRVRVIPSNPENPANPENPDSDKAAWFARRVRVSPSRRIFVDSARPQGYTFLASVCMASRQRGHSPVNYYLLAMDSARVWEKIPYLWACKGMSTETKRRAQPADPLSLHGRGLG